MGKTNTYPSSVLLTYDLDSSAPNQEQQHTDFKRGLLGLANGLADAMTQGDLPQSTVILPMQNATQVNAHVLAAAARAKCKILRYSFSIGNIVTLVVM